MPTTLSSVAAGSNLSGGGGAAGLSCPACTATDTTLQRTHGIADAAAHFIPEGRDPDRYRRLCVQLGELFGSDHVDMWRCAACGFWFADPFVAGTPEIYNLITGGRARYPGNRFEFDRTLEALGRGPVDLLEIGAGAGAFLSRARAAEITRRVCATAYDDRSLDALRAIPGVEAVKRSPQELAGAGFGHFDAVCMFHVLERLDRLDDVFASLRRLLATEGHLFVGVRNDASVTVQEDLTGCWEMPPNHTGRWTRPALESVAARHGLAVIDHRYESGHPLAALWEMARCRCQARADRPKSLAGRVNALRVRAIRDPAKDALAAWDLLVLLPHYRGIPPRSQWFRLRIRR